MPLPTDTFGPLADLRQTRQLNNIFNRLHAIESDPKVKTIKVSLNATQIKNLGTTEVLAIASPGAGKVIQLNQIIYNYTAGVAVYDDNPIVIGAPFPAGTTIVMAAGLDALFDELSISPAFTSYVKVNQPMVIRGTDSVATGDGVIDIYISYQIVTL